MRSFLKVFLFSLVLVTVLAACSNDKKPAGKQDEEVIHVVSTFTIITDMIHEIGGDKVKVHNLVPTGTDPHEYEPLPDDIKAATDADVLFYNGFDLEGGENGWFFKLVNSVGQDLENVYSLTERIEPMYITDEAGTKEANPHSFISPKVGIKMTEDARDALIEIDPDNADYYTENAEAYLERLGEIDKEYEEKIADIPEKNRTLVTSERAFQYLADHYGLEEGYIWAIDTEENGSPKQIKSLVEFLKERKVPVLFVETNVDPRAMETVSKESGIEIYGEIYSDEIGQPGEEIDTYVKYLEYNIEQIYNGLKDK